jgi:hypothetical protein
MKVKFTEEEFNKAKSDDKLNFECYYCNNLFQKKKKYYLHELKSNKGEIRFCNKKCDYESKVKKIIFNCAECKKEVLKRPKEQLKSKSGNVFCSKSCAASYNNTHKTTGTRRSKMEIWIEEELTKKYDFVILFNNKETIGSELDIYIPHLKLAFELNGIFHYEPIYGDKKLEQTINNDNRKFQACLEKTIEFCTIDTSGSKKFKPERDKKYLEIIEKIINMKNITLQQQQQMIKLD